ncbi:DedA family protein [Bacillus alkalicellulosilyticus]|uniref:DedA family protein n=1 Tax=Alkalihalobacterium alkalicellulosilyticum TaxID=1912214 RepID=UPI00099836B4|nr:DedA family protein [Bacillus alkalicellulosilyticus]
MDVDFLLVAVKDYGYVALFLWVWLGMFIAPVPNEVLVSSFGFISGTLLHPPLAFIMTYSGIVASLTTSFFIGRFIGYPVLQWLQRKGTRKYITIATSLIDKYQTYSLSFSYFIPGVRNIVPFLYGMRKLSFLKFALLAYSSAFVWCSLFFFSGMYFGQFSQGYPWESLVLMIGASLIILYCGLFLVKKFVTNKLEQQKERHHH